MNTVISQKISTTRATMATAALVLAAMLACPSSASAQICAYICPAGQIWTGGTTCLSQCNGVSSSVNNGDGICEVNAENSGNTPADCPTGVDPNILPFCPGYLITDLSVHKLMIPPALYGWRSQETAQQRSNDDAACTAANGGTPAIYITDFMNAAPSGPFLLYLWRSGVCCPGSTCGVACNNNGTCDNGETYGTCPGDCGNCTATSFSSGGNCDASMPINAATNGSSTPYNCSSMGACTGTFNAICTNGFWSFSNTCCGNGSCDAGETFGSCPADCFCNMNSTCEPVHGETHANCPGDCPCNGNGICDGTETMANCPGECFCILNGLCEPIYGENNVTCPGDCSCNNNGTCDAGETNATCPSDCPCNNNGTCDGAETLANCPADCTCTYYFDYGAPLPLNSSGCDCIDAGIPGGPTVCPIDTSVPPYDNPLWVTDPVTPHPLPGNAVLVINECTTYWSNMWGAYAKFLYTLWSANCSAAVCGNSVCETGETNINCPVDCGCPATTHSPGGACSASVGINAASNGSSTPYSCASAGACSGTFNAVCTNGTWSYSGNCCGDGAIGAGEQCDDSGITNGDGCSSTCQCDGATPVYSNGHCCPAGQFWNGSACAVGSGQCPIASKCNTSDGYGLCGGPETIWFSATNAGTIGTGSCPPTYYGGSASMTCQANGTWNDASFVNNCTRAMCAFQLFTVNGSTYFGWPDMTPVGATKTYQCSLLTGAGDTLGEHSGTCQSDGSWAVTSSCQCPSLVVNGSPGGTVTIPDTRIGRLGQAFCAGSYSGTVKATCGSNGIWGAASNTCVPMVSCNNGLLDGIEACDGALGLAGAQANVTIGSTSGYNIDASTCDTAHGCVEHRTGHCPGFAVPNNASYWRDTFDQVATDNTHNWTTYSGGSDVTPTYSEFASGDACEYHCNANYHWNGASCYACPVGTTWDNFSQTCACNMPGTMDVTNVAGTYYLNSRGCCAFTKSAGADATGGTACAAMQTDLDNCCMSQGYDYADTACGDGGYWNCM